MQAQLVEFLPLRFREASRNEIPLTELSLLTTKSCRVPGVTEAAGLYPLAAVKTRRDAIEKNFERESFLGTRTNRPTL
jgi:hypothetical protein